MQRVAVVLETFSEFGRSVMRGVASYVDHGPQWELHAPPLGKNDEMVLKAASETDGIITRPFNEPMAQIVRESAVPIVAVHYRGDLPIPRVRSDPERIAQMAMEHFQAQGFRHFGFFGPGGKDFSIERGAAFERLLAAEGYSCSACFGARTAPTEYRWSPRGEDVIRWLRSLPKPAAVLTANDSAGQELLLIARHAGVRVPDELAVVGVDNDELVCRLSTPPLSSIDIGGERIGFEAAVMLNRMFNGEQLGAKTVLVKPERLVVRQSSNTLAVENPQVAEAIRYIRENVALNIGVDDVLREIPIGRRSLELAFRKVLGRSIHEEILESRIRRAKQLLVETDMPIPKVTKQCGFGNRQRLSAVFRKHTGHSPREFRLAFRKPA